MVVMGGGTGVVVGLVVMVWVKNSYDGSNNWVRGCGCDSVVGSGGDCGGDG